MESEAWLRVLRALAGGVHPVTGEVYPPDSPYQEPLVIRALHQAILFCERNDRAGRARRGAATAAEGGGRRRASIWTPEEDQLLAQRYQDGASVRLIAQGLKRSPGAVVRRLMLLGLVDDEQHVRE